MIIRISTYHRHLVELLQTLHGVLRHHDLEKDFLDLGMWKFLQPSQDIEIKQTFVVIGIFCIIGKIIMEL